MGKPTIVSFVWFMMNSCTLVSALGNLWIEEGSYKILLWPAVILALPMLFPVAMNWLAEPPAKTFCKPEVAKVAKHKGCFLLAMFLAFGALTGSALVLTYAADDSAQFTILLPYYAGCGLTFVIVSKFVLSPDIWGPAVYMFLCSALTLYFSGTQQGFYTFRNAHGLPEEQADPCFNETTNTTEPDCQSYCMADLPGFSTSYYQTVGQFLGAVAAVIAVLIFDQVIVKWKTRPAFWITTAFKGVATILEVMIIERWNHKLFGTVAGHPDAQWVDQIFFLFGAQAIYKIVDMLDFMPNNVLIGNMCPKGMEATIFAVLAGSQNFGSTIANINGGIFTTYMGVVYSRNFVDCANPPVAWAGGMSAFGVVRVMAGIVLPAITVPLTFVLLPDKLLAEKYEQPDADEGEVELAGAGEAGASFDAPKAATKETLLSGGVLSMGFAAKSNSRLF